MSANDLRAATAARSRADLDAGQADKRAVNSTCLHAKAQASVMQAGLLFMPLITVIRFNLPGQINAQVTKAVYESPAGRDPLIPQGA
ncbi:hypothetical protein [Lichenifustis flavocetrariae]|uniref:Uncharacterized protein n=1 Tax=Lichenifustis flavocetrariae TaxID=2949735 RepID=A0AA41YZX6_9HYPH|nr:hypothetical protein [Lichenifustis flavocetrariae]MCW6511654.1 hypothetical protein [Lichenifustis flavocetrariae]